jgi:hypothetical protein
MPIRAAHVLLFVDPPENFYFASGKFKSPAGSSNPRREVQIPSRKFKSPAGSSNPQREVQIPSGKFKSPAGSSNLQREVQIPSGKFKSPMGSSNPQREVRSRFINVEKLGKHDSTYSIRGTEEIGGKAFCQNFKSILRFSKCRKRRSWRLIGQSTVINKRIKILTAV